MEFEKKLKTRLFVAIGYIVIGIGMILVFNLIARENSYLSSLGLAFALIGIVRVRNYFKITKNKETIEMQRIKETDERNVAIANKAKSFAFMAYILISAVAVIVLQLLNLTEIMLYVSGFMCLMLVIYWVSYLIISKTN